MARALTACLCFVFAFHPERISPSHSNYTHHRKIEEATSIRQAYDIIRKVPMFKNLGQQFSEEVASAMTTVHYEPNTYICQQGTDGENLYVLTEGAVQITKNYKAGGTLYDNRTMLLLPHVGSWWSEPSPFSIRQLDSRMEDAPPHPTLCSPERRSPPNSHLRIRVGYER